MHGKRVAGAKKVSQSTKFMTRALYSFAMKMCDFMRMLEINLLHCTADVEWFACISAAFFAIKL